MNSKTNTPKAYEVGIDEGDEIGTRTLAAFPNIYLAEAFMYGYKMAQPNAKLFIDTITSDFLSTLNK